mgnify:CR=1
MSKNERKTKSCKNHQKLSRDERETLALSYAQKLCDAFNFALQETHKSDSELYEIIRRGEIYPSVEGFEKMNIAAIGFLDLEGLSKHSLAYTWDFIDEEPIEKLGYYIIEQVIEVQEEGTLPLTIEEFFK